MQYVYIKHGYSVAAETLVGIWFQANGTGDSAVDEMAPMTCRLGSVYVDLAYGVGLALFYVPRVFHLHIHSSCSSLYPDQKVNQAGGLIHSCLMMVTGTNV